MHTPKITYTGFLIIRSLTSHNIFCVRIFALIYLTASLLHAQQDTVDIYSLDFTQLSKMEISTHSKVVQNVIEVPATVSVITSEEIKLNGYFTLEEALSSLPGMQFRNIQGINSYVFMRGIPNQNNLVLILVDGVQINELNSGGFYAGGQFNLSNVDRIEVVYGPSSVAYGTNAISGVINIITKDAKENHKTVSLRYGSFNTFAADANYNFVNADSSLAFKFSGMYKQTDKADLKGNNGDNNWSDQMENYEKDFAFDAKLQLDNFIFGTNFQQKQTPSTTHNKSIGTIYKDQGTLWNIRFINAYLKYQKNISSSLNFTSILYNRNTTVLPNTIREIVDTAQIGYYRPNNLTGAEGILDYKYDETFSIAGGLTLKYESIAEKPSLTYSSSPFIAPPTPAAPNMLNNTLLSVFIEPRLIVYQSIYLSGGYRYDNSSSYDQVFTPRFGLSYSFYKHVLRLSYSEAFRAPRPWDYTDGLGNSNLKPEEISSFETSINLSLSNNFDFDLIGYINKLKNGLVRENISGGWRWINTDEFNTIGSELVFSFVTSKLRASINYTFTETEDKKGAFIPEISKHVGNACVTYLITNNITFNLRANYLGKRKNPKMIPATNSNTIEPALVFHGSLYFFNYYGLSASLNINNIFNAEYYHPSNRSPSRYRQSQRTLIFSLSYNLGELDK